MALCKLCLQERPLVEGHILSEFLYAELYDLPHHRFHQLHTDPAKRNLLRPKGLYERMMCHACDNEVINGYEAYASKVLYGGVEIVIDDRPDKVLVSELDYTKFKLFQVSLLWRSAISTREEFSAVGVSADDAERMRHMLLKNDPGEQHEYGCIMWMPAMHNVLRQTIMPPDHVEIAGYNCIRFLAGGYWWLNVVSRDARDFEAHELFLSKNGRLQIIKEGSYSTAFMLKFAADLVKNPSFPRQSPR